MSAERVQKILAGAGVCSRREADEWIREGRVRVNGKVIEPGARADPGTDSIRVDGRVVRLARRPRRYVLLYKPRGVLSTTSDPEGRPTVLDLLPSSLRKGLKPVGRLDADSEGLLILTDDGDFAQAVSHPSRGVSKEYLVKVWRRPPEGDLDRLRRGVVLDGKRTAPCEIALHHQTRHGEEANVWLLVTLHEGRSRQIRRMFETIGHPVSKLKRLSIGPVRDSRLSPGSYRALTPAEIRRLSGKGDDRRRH